MAESGDACQHHVPRYQVRELPPRFGVLVGVCQHFFRASISPSDPHPTIHLAICQPSIRAHLPSASIPTTSTAKQDRVHIHRETMTSTKSQAHTALESPWIDAWVRWERNSMETYNDDDQEHDDDEHEQELPPPTETYTFTYPNPKSSESADSITIELRGFDSDSEQIWNSTGLTVWKSSHHLCNYLVEHSRMLENNKRILELGSGLGRCGILAHKLVRKANADCDVYLTDGDTDTLTQLRDNKKHNVDSDDIKSSASEVFCHQLIWGRETAQNFLSHRASNRAFDIMFGSDLIYVQSVIVPLFETVETLLSHKADSIFIMAHSNRRKGNEVDVDMVLDAADKAGLRYEVAEQVDDISVFVFRRRARDDDVEKEN